MTLFACVKYIIANYRAPKALWLGRLVSFAKLTPRFAQVMPFDLLECSDMPNSSSEAHRLKPAPGTPVKRDAPKARPGHPVNKAEHAALKRADKRVAKPWMKKR